MVACRRHPDLTGGVSLTGATILEVTTDVANDPGPAIAFWVLFLASTLAHVAAMFPLALGRGDGRGAVGASLVGRAALLGFGAFFLANQSMYLFTAYLVPTVVLPAGAANFLFAMSAAQGVLLLVGGTIILGARVLTGPARWAVLALSLVGFAVGSVATSASLETLTNTMYFLSTGTQIVAVSSSAERASRRARSSVCSVPRSYHTPRRQADAAATRANIIDAAARLFIRDGYVATSLKAIAAEADVSVPTVHANGPKHALLIAAFERTFAGDEGRHSLATSRVRARRHHERARHRPPSAPLRRLPHRRQPAFRGDRGGDARRGRQ